MKKKAGPADVRPIACGETMRRMVGQIILKKVLANGIASLKPFQVGVGVKDAATYVALGCARVLPKLRTDSSYGLLQIDLVNAFNTVSREAVLRMVKAKVPTLFPWAQWSLSGPSTLYCRQHKLQGKTGVHQGSPLGPLLLCYPAIDTDGVVSR